MRNLAKFKEVILDSKEDISSYLNINDAEVFSPASEYFYTKILESKDKSISDKLKDDQFLERCYACLIAWRLNRGQSWLVSFDDFKKQLNLQKENLIKLDQVKNLEKLDIDEYKSIFEEIFKSWNLVTIRKGEKDAESKFVSISKTLHFLLPDLVIPMDNAYTAKIINFQGTLENQCKSFIEILSIGKKILYKYKEHIDIKEQKTDTKPKIIDNIIINYVNRLPKKEKY